MNKIGTRIFAGFVAAGIGFGAVGCGNNKNDNEVQVQSNSLATSTISWTLHQNAPIPENAEMIRYLEEKYNVDLDIWNLENNRYESLLELKIAQQGAPDLLRVRQPQDLLKVQQQGLVTEIPLDTLEHSAPNLFAALNKYAPGYLEDGKIEGKLYGIPVINPTNAYRIPVVYRQDWLDKLGLKVPDTLAEFEKMIYAFTFEDPDGNGIDDTYGLSMEGMNVVFGAFGQIVFADQLYFNEKNGKKVIGALEPEMKEALRYLRKWYADGVIDPQFLTGENKGGYKHLSHAFINGRIGMTSMGNYYHWIDDNDYLAWNVDERGLVIEKPVQATYNIKELKAKNPDAKVSFGRPFMGPHGKRGSKAYDMLMSFTAIGANVVDEPGKMEKILQILDDVSANPDDNELTTWKNGIIGKHWNWADASHQDIVTLPPYDRETNLLNKIGANIGMTLPFPQTGRREQWASTLHLDQDGIYNALEIATPSLVRSSEQLIALRNQAYLAFITGERPLDEFDNFVQEFRKAGGDEVLREANALTSYTR
ncbi:extracellular solute-binding protein [Saccharibacillus sp. JS10]|uniref:extracellular solute-binding protein n=1 Tax=Saccharibacillus sp. JS10 TaxID=2950552 RepID=UPI00210C2D15|nr:extracellular solute-binding protein [Saccharibacillus sp. JS10]MCQ4087841.1 extracellular solute-binding protein [Saccharibacillus sp. JS10]